MILAVLVLTSCGYFPPVCSSTRRSMSLLCAGSVHRRLWRPHGHAQPALSSSPGGSTPHSARSSNRARQWHFIRAERSSNDSCRSHRALEGSSLPSCFVPFVFFPRLATPALNVFLRRYGRRSRQPSSSSVARRARVQVFAVFAGIAVFNTVRRYGYSFSSRSSTGTP